MSLSAPRIAILLAAYQGGRFLTAQLNSLAGQSHPDWRLIVSDDGSTDDTVDLVRKFANEHPGRDVTILDGPRQGATQNFLHLIGQVEPGEALAFCDQDDVWLPDRLARGVAALHPEAAFAGTRIGAGPAMHVTRTTICDEDLRPLGPAPLFVRPPGFLNALVQACTPGNTTLVNPDGVGLLQRATEAAAMAGIISHDWWTYQAIAGAGGIVLRDPAQTVLYRQHRGNVMGRNDTPRAKLARLIRLGDGAYGAWLRSNAAALQTSSDILTVANRRHLDRFARALELSGAQAAVELMRLGVYRQTRAGTAALLAAAAAGRLRA